MQMTDPFPLSRDRGCVLNFFAPPRAARACGRTFFSAGAVTCPPGEAGAERRGRWGRGMARCAALGGWHKRRRRGRRKKLGEESSGRKGAKKALEPGRRREPGVVWGRAPAGVAERGDPGKGRVGVGRGGGNAPGTLSAGRLGGGVGAESARRRRGRGGRGRWVRAVCRPGLRRLQRPERGGPRQSGLGGAAFSCPSPSA